jgi:hypothetical protein
MEKSFSSLESIESALRERGCRYALVKALARNQDNEKNQIYLGAEAGLSQMLPGSSGIRQASASQEKDWSEPGRLITELKIELAWLWPDGQAYPAPSARIIDYFQYARAGETRLSGFLAGCTRSPRSLRRAEMDPYGRRALILGIADEEIFGVVVTDIDGSGLIDALCALPRVPTHGALQRWDLRDDESVLDVNRLLGDLRKIAGRELEASELRGASRHPHPRRAQQGGGWTLEAHLGIPQNSVSGPDKHGFELKSVGGDQVTLITTEPDLGVRCEGFVEYLKTYGWESHERPGHYVFNGAHRCGQPNDRSGAMLVVDHWDLERNAPGGGGEPRVLLVHIRTDQVIAGWSYARLAEAWSKKHAGAAYVETVSMNHDGGKYPSHYRYGPTVCVGVGTNVLRYLQGLVRGDVYLDPGDSLSPDRVQKRRTQWRLRGSIRRTLPPRLAPLYVDFDVHQLY